MKTDMVATSVEDCATLSANRSTVIDNGRSINKRRHESSLKEDQWTRRRRLDRRHRESAPVYKKKDP